ncbi:unnamed protein product [Blepharisma stoltei]|uniref:Calmodulin n=1 Tax=Blepharisma stoltei TaxID=1481888 RepID=A0AAU9K5P4_9CILI|nr:unnamed protein product [Blepharisma stoltei]
MVEKFSEDEIENYRKIFQSMDKDASGNISSKELSFALRKVGVSVNSEQIDDIMKDVDVDSDGNLQFEEFLQIAAKSTKDVDAEEELKEIFMIFDRENTGFIAPGQIKHVMKSLGQPMNDEELYEIMGEGDRDQDGLLSFEEFTALMLAKEAPKQQT